ncbi:protein with signal peptide [Prochlorococcus marinus str. MIT 9312]|uniref:Protein with signal peptide n=1 Tax=Prochlorococcus marinus (strain MIT 9312) TaxID=74546 RepID=Q31A87_PROM9|nr:hypothetical protein [Prochlorococcus marinus]ABB50208.1 protein with signal peptide [Prochlorococcus marinus str. MIT 9312]KGG01600.1 putative protein with signal peptide [Prochlorococcus marinus str. MIT 9311]
MKDFNNSKIRFATSLVSTNDQSAGGYHYQLDTTINILVVNDIVEKENGFERSDNLVFSVFHKDYYAEKKLIYLYAGPTNSNIKRGADSFSLVSDDFESLQNVPLLLNAIKDVIKSNHKCVYLDKGKDETYDPVPFLARIDSLSKTSSIVRFTKGLDAINNEEPNNELNLISAQKLSDKFKDSKVLDKNDIELVKIIFTTTPLTFGYWGTFKALMKKFDPELLPIEFGKALARLSVHPGAKSHDSYHYPNFNFENLIWLKDIVPLPNRRTIDYLARRMRRELKKIGDTKPALYTSVVSTMLIEFDSWDSQITNKSFIPAYVLSGKYLELDGYRKSRVVYLPLFQQKRSDPHSEAWNKNISKVIDIFNNVRNSSEIFNFSYQILKDNNQIITDLTKNNVLLALSSNFDELVLIALKTIPRFFKDLFNQISADNWMMFFERSDMKSFGIFIDEVRCVGTGMGNIYLFNALEKYFSANVKDNIERAAPLAGMYLRFLPRYVYSAEKFRKVLELVTSFYSFSKSSEIWRISLDKIPFNLLLAFYFEIITNKNFVEGNLEIIEEVILSKCKSNKSYLYGYGYGYNDIFIESIIKCFISGEKKVEEFGWLLLNKYQDSSDLDQRKIQIERIFQWLKDTHLDPIKIQIEPMIQWLKNTHPSSYFLGEKWETRRIDLIGILLEKYPYLSDEKIVDILTDNGWSLTSSGKLYFLIKNASPMKSRIIWNALANDNSNEIKDLVLIDKSFLKVFGDSINIEDLSKCGNIQHEVLKKYIENNPSRIKNDISFGLALAAVPNPALQDIAIDQLLKINALQSKWLLLAEIGLPKPILAARKFIESLSDKEELSNCILASIDSSVFTVRDMGLELLDKNSEIINNEKLLASLSTSDDHKVQGRVAEELLIRESDNPVFEDFDNRILITRRRNRKAKEKIKDRLDSDSKIKNQEILSPKRIEALLNLAKGKNIRDREWALNRIASLSIKGVRFDGIEIEKTNTRRNK